MWRGQKFRNCEKASAGSKRNTRSGPEWPPPRKLRHGWELLTRPAVRTRTPNTDATRDLLYVVVVVVVTFGYNVVVVVVVVVTLRFTSKT